MTNKKQAMAKATATATANTTATAKAMATENTAILRFAQDDGENL
jgi:hypothetical protein